MNAHIAERIAHQGAFDSNGATRILAALMPVRKPRVAKPVTLRRFSFQ